MRYLFGLTTILTLMFIMGCTSSTGVLDPEIVERLDGQWEGTLDYTPSGGEAVAMTLEFNVRSVFWLSAIMVSEAVTYEDEDVSNVGDDFEMKFDVPGETWFLVLRGRIAGTDIEGDIIHRVDGAQDVIIGTWTASPVP
jgi:hypothetical protein